MAFDADNFDLNGSGSKGGMKISAYITSVDAIAAVIASGYFDAQEANITTGDVIIVTASDASRVCAMVNTAGVITVGSSVALA